ncbi:hypothetical protein OsJ_23114 [Oryza sativa Japonica Group]|uniref:Uncharacterized protein n=1 Tax=Oryza sativa subsp. japonica TaxID=39947 RepID=Q69JL9_ORYSJ|nr:hypothetical protein OsJ_23114 [Oryza sativa Japonica Group]BAC79512.1 hypothetical protein [Oryza sativa Japonica Group]BAD31910.1 hypothetical protein [Oryza sativa Japonica Group]
MATRYLRPVVAALRRPAVAASRSLSANATQGVGRTGTTGITSSLKAGKNVDEEIRLLLVEVAKLEVASRRMEETIRNSRFHRRKVLREYIAGLEIQQKYTPPTPN